MSETIEKLFSEEQIAVKVKEVAEWLDERFKGVDTVPLAVSVLKGSVFFFSDVVRAMKTPVQLDFMSVSSYGNSTESSGVPKIVMDLSVSVSGRDVILFEDIIDSGYTLEKLKELILGRGANSCTIVTLFNKSARRMAAIEADFYCFEIGDEFIVGYGLDYAQRYRNLPYVGILNCKN